jgi:hypothetical protein
MRLTVGPLPATVYWRRRAVVAVALVLVIVLLATMCGRPDTSKPGGQPGPNSSSPRTGGPGSSPSGAPTGSPSGSLPDGSTAGTPSVGATVSTGPGGDATAGTGGSGDDGVDNGTGGGGAGGGGDSGENGGPQAPPVVATVPCSDAEISLTTTVSPSPGVYGGVLTFTLSVRNISDHPCLRDVGSGPQELQVRQGSTVLWSSDSCNTPQASDVRAFGPNIESQFWRRWNTYRIAPHDCDTPAGALPAAPGTYQVVARLGGKLSEPVNFDIQQ